MKSKKYIISGNEEKKLIEINKLLIEEEYDKVIEQSVKAIDSYPDQNFFYIMLSLAKLQIGNTEEALKIITDAENIFPGEFEILFQTAKVYEEMKQDDKAEEYFKMSFKATPEDYFEARSDCMNDLGAMKYYQGNEDEAIKCWEKAIEINPDNASAISNLHHVLFD